MSCFGKSNIFPNVAHSFRGCITSLVAAALVLVGGGRCDAVGTVGGTANDGGLVEGIVGRGELEEDFPFEDVRFVFVRIGVLEGDVGDGGAFDGDAFFRETFGGRHGAAVC
eukprot:scaffold127776_cov25-Cyclotella_meneghiniana.AAC.1